MKRCSYYLILTLCLAGISIPQSKNDQKSVQNTNVNWAQRALQGYNMRVWISNQMTMGLRAWDCGSQDCIPVEPHTLYWKALERLEIKDNSSLKLTSYFSGFVVFLNSLSPPDSGLDNISGATVSFLT